MKLRLAQTADASSIAALSIEVWIGTYLKKGVSGFFADYALDTFTVAKTERLITDPQHWVLVSENAEGIDGFIVVTSNAIAPVEGCSETEISTFYIQPRHHGKGIGTALLRAAVAYAQETGAPSVWLTTNAENAPAIGFYLSVGFEHVGETHFRIEGEGYLNNVYRLPLPAARLVSGD